MEQQDSSVIRLRFSGDIVVGNAISIRTLGNTLPHFQRAVDKAVLFANDGKYKRGYGISRNNYVDADLMLSFIEDGSVILPLWNKLKGSAYDFLQWSLREPYESALSGNVQTPQSKKIDIYRTRARSGDLAEVTQKQLMDDAENNRREYARSAVLSDFNKMLSVIRTSGEHQLDLKFEKPGKEAEFSFNGTRAKAFSKIVNTPVPTEPAIYKGKYQGYKAIAGKNLEFEVYVLSSWSGQLVNVYVKGTEQLNVFKSLEHNEEILFYASPLQKYGSFDAYNGSVVFVDKYRK